MDLELQPFAGATFQAAKIGPLLVLNTAYAQIEEGAYAIYTIFKDEQEGPNPVYYVSRSSWQRADTQNLLKRLITYISKPGERIVYVASPAPIVPLLIQAAAMVKNKKRKPPKKKARPRHRREAAVDGSISITSTLHQQGKDGSDAYALHAECEVSPIKRPAVHKPITSAALFSSRSASAARPGAERWRAGLEGFPMHLRIHATTEEAFIRYIEEAIREWGSPVELTREFIGRALEYIYFNPVVCYRVYVSGEGMPSVASVERNASAFSDSVNAYAQRFHEIVGRCQCRIFIPPMPSEEGFRLMTRVEVSIVPAILDKEFLLERLPDGEDPLFDKIYQYLPDGASSYLPGKGDKPKKGGKRRLLDRPGPGDQLVFPYGALIDAGQIFTYGDCAELSARMQRLA